MSSSTPEEPPTPLADDIPSAVDSPSPPPPLSPPPLPPSSPPQASPDRISIFVLFDLPPQLTLDKRNSWQTLGFEIARTASISVLRACVRNVCDQAAPKNKQLLEDEFYAKGKDLAGTARICLEGDYEGESGRSEPVDLNRVECVGDLLSRPELKKGGKLIVVRVEMKVIERGSKKKEKKSGKKIGLSGDGQIRERRGTLPLPLQQDASSTATHPHSHEPMVQAILHSTSSTSFAVPAREVDSRLIGSTSHATPLPFDLQTVPRSEFLDDESPDPRLPHLPALTLTDYTPAPDNDTAAVAAYLEKTGKRIELAVRFVTRIPGKQGDLLFLPANVVMSVKHCPGQKKSVSNRLRADLKQFGLSASAQDTPEQQKKKKLLLEVLFGGKEKDETKIKEAGKKEKGPAPAWEFHLFVLPQEPRTPASPVSPTSASPTSATPSPSLSTSTLSLPPKNNKAKLYPFQGGSLARFLHSSAVLSDSDNDSNNDSKSNNANMRLYMEAHIVLRKEEEEDSEEDNGEFGLALLGSKGKKKENVILFNFKTSSITSSDDSSPDSSEAEADGEANEGVGLGLGLGAGQETNKSGTGKGEKAEQKDKTGRKDPNSNEPARLLLSRALAEARLRLDRAKISDQIERLSEGRAGGGSADELFVGGSGADPQGDEKSDSGDSSSTFGGSSSGSTFGGGGGGVHDELD